MTRQKKTRTVGLAPSQPLPAKKVTENDIIGRARKKQKKRKGLNAGERHSPLTQKQQQVANGHRDPRIGSKKPIPLIVETPQPQQQTTSAEQALAALENDSQLHLLLERMEKGEKLGAGLQAEVDRKLDQIAHLMQQLGLSDLNTESAPPQAEPTKQPSAQQARTADQLLDEFNTIHLNDFKDS